MSWNKTAEVPRQDPAQVTAAQWFAGGQRIGYDPGSARVLTEEDAAATPGALRVFERVAAEPDTDKDAVWLTLLPGFPDGSYGWAQVDRMLGAGLRPRLYVEPIGQGDSDKPRDYQYSTIGRADLVEALWRHHAVRRTVVVTFDYTSPRVFDTTILQARLFSRSYHPAPQELAELRSAITRRNGAPFLHDAAGFVAEHRRQASRWDLAAIARDLDGTVALYVGGSDEDPYEHRQIAATRERVPGAQILTFPGGHLTTSEHPDLLAAAIGDIAARHGAANPAIPHR